MTATVDAAPTVAAKPTRPFSPFEWLVAFRYLRARNAQKSISVIAGFSFLGIVLGVAALIVVMSVMNGFRHDLMEKMIGLNGHMFLQGIDTPLTDYEAVTERVSKVPGVTLALPLGRGPGLRDLAIRLVGSAGARRSPEGPRAPAGRRRPHHSRFARRLRSGAGGCGRREARRAPGLSGSATR